MECSLTRFVVHAFTCYVLRGGGIFLSINRSICQRERELEVICFLRREFRELAKRSVGQLGRFVVSGERREVQNRRVFVGRSGEVGS